MTKWVKHNEEINVQKKNLIDFIKLMFPPTVKAARSVFILFTRMILGHIFFKK